MRHMQSEAIELPLARPFAISRSTRTSVTVVRVSIEQDGFIGLGECTPTAHYGETPESVMAQLSAVKSQIESGVSRQALQNLLGAGSARNAIDCALWRLQQALQQQTQWQLCEQAKPEYITTAQTISLGDCAAMVADAKEAIGLGCRLLKIKLDAGQVVEKVAAIRAVSGDATLIIDANEAWHADNVAQLCEQLQHYDVRMIEQPLPAGHDEVLSTFSHPIPICADESCHTGADIAALANRYDFINIKLDKCGGLSEALAMVTIARQHKMRLMVGCMLGSSLAMESALPVAAQAEIVDLDGPVWLAADNSPYLHYRAGRILL